MCQATVKNRGPWLNWDASLHDQGLARLLEKGASLAACDRFLDAGGDVGKTLKVKQTFPAKSPVEGRCKQGSSWGSLGNSRPMEGWCNSWFDNGIPGGKGEAGDRERTFNALHV